MNISALSSAARGAEIPLEELAAHPDLTDQDKLAQVSRQFEAALLRQILADARKPVFPSKFTDQSAIHGIYDDMVTHQLAENISQSGEFGLARSLQAQLNRPAATPPPAPATGETAGPKPKSAD